VEVLTQQARTRQLDFADNAVVRDLSEVAHESDV
jgi:hypothetical protein